MKNTKGDVKVEKHDKTEKNEIFDLIITLTKGIQNKDNAVKCKFRNDDYKLNACTYLLGQVLRQYSKNGGRIYVSEKAAEKWKLLSGHEMNDYWYRNTVTCDGEAFKNSEVVEECLYKGNSNTPEKLCFKKGNKFSFREIFHDEHIIPIASIIEDLTNLKGDDLNYDNVEKVLANLCLCRILKSEDRSIKSRYARPKCLIKAYEEAYQKVNDKPINLIGWDKIEEEYKKEHGCDGGCDKCSLKGTFRRSRKSKNTQDKE